MRMLRLSLTIGAALVAASSLMAQEAAKQKPGIYLTVPGKSGAEQTTRLLGAIPHLETRGIGKSILTQGISKPAEVASLDGTGADIRIKDTTPTFYFYFNTGNSQPNPNDPMAAMAAMGSGPGDMMPATARTASDFVLVKMTVTKDGREVEVGKMGSNSKSKAAIDCVVERLAQGEYKAHAKDPLKPGEYAFYYNNSQGGGMGSGLWDFGIDGGV